MKGQSSEAPGSHGPLSALGQPPKEGRGWTVGGPCTVPNKFLKDLILISSTGTLLHPGLLVVLCLFLEQADVFTP